LLGTLAMARRPMAGLCSHQPHDEPYEIVAYLANCK
jgi:hypothetical protein